MVLDAYCDWNDLYTVTPGGPGYSSKVEVNENSRVSLVDFGLSERYITEETDDMNFAKHIRFEKINRTLGNKFFMSLN